MAYVCPYYGPRMVWSVPQASYPVYYHTAPSWPSYTCCASTCCCAACCCHCTCQQAAAAANAAVNAAVKAVTAAGNTPTAKSGKIQVQGKMELKASPEDTQKLRENNRRTDEEETPRSWRRVSSLPKLRAERPSRDYSDDYSSPRRHRSRRYKNDSPDGRCEGTFVIKGMPRYERREPRRRPEPTRNNDRDCTLKGTITFDAE